MTALMYHDVVAAGDEDASGFPGRDAALYKVTPEQFAAHLDAIITGRSASPSAGAIHERSSADQLARPADACALHTPDLPDLSITFDDGGVSAMRAAEALEARALRGSFFVTANYIGTRGFVAAGDLRDLAARGHTI